VRLKLIRVTGFKRFGDRVQLDTRGPIIAIVGPNEAGKTSLLEAIAHVSKDEPFGAHEFTDRNAGDAEQAVVVAEFSLDADDRAALGDLVGDGVDLTYASWRYPSGDRRYSVQPRHPRDGRHRAGAVAALDQALKDGWLEPLDEDEPEADRGGRPRLAERARALVGALRSLADNLGEEVHLELDALAAAVNQEVPDGVETDRTELFDVLSVASAFERESPPEQRINAILASRLPQFLLFTDEDRTLRTEYVWGEHPTPPRGLENVFALAKTNYLHLKAAAMNDDRTTTETLLEQGNAELDEAFKAWRQADLHVSLSVNQRSLQLLVRDRATAKRTRLDERSAGLRSFVALIAFAARHASTVRPVLLVDEAETHLHYGAQADLMRVFERQRVAETIIYTTHSIGCLPSDLGATIRVVALLRANTTEAPSITRCGQPSVAPGSRR
jgi:ABC-type transport system involved in cytochrome c biogenesis ATPase subunit